MPPNVVPQNVNWTIAQKNPSYWRDSLTDEEGRLIKWHSPSSPVSSQVFCISAFCGLRSSPDCTNILNRLLTNPASALPAAKRWHIHPEHTDAVLLGETGQGTPTNIDIFCTSTTGVVCIEAKFLHDAEEGFGTCGQVKRERCAGFYGVGSDLRTKAEARCRLEVPEGKRDARLYWQLGRKYFQDEVFDEQHAGDRCPFANGHFQLMRNFLLAAESAGGEQEFAVVAIVPEKKTFEVRKQVASFQQAILLAPFRSRINVVSYDQLSTLMVGSPYPQTVALGKFLQDRMSALL